MTTKSKVDRHLDACRAMISGAALIAGGMTAVAPMPVAQGALYYASGFYYGTKGGGGDALFIDLDAAPGTVGVKMVYGKATPGDFSAYPGYELQIIVGKIGPSLYDNTGDDLVLFTVGAYGGYTFYTYPDRLTEGYVVDLSSTFAPDPAKSFIHELSLYNTFWSPYGIYSTAGTYGHVGFKMFDGKTSTSTFGSIYFPLVYDLKPAFAFGWYVSAVQWDSTASSITVTSTPGAVPEPSSLGLAMLAGGAAALGRWRRRHQTA